MPFSSDEDIRNLSPAEDAAWQRANRLGKGIQNRRMLVDDAAVQHYINSVAAKLFPEMKQTIQVFVFRSSNPQAFALVNGRIFVTIGMLARMENEDQLAFILGHEGAHFISKHVVTAIERYHSTSGYLDIPWVGELVVASSLAGFSRDHEREADSIALERMTDAGYDPHEAIRVMQGLLEETRLLGGEDDSAFGTHPTLEDRIATFHEFVVDAVRPSKHSGDTFLASTEKVRIFALNEDLERRHVWHVIANLERADALNRFEVHRRHYTLGEAYRILGRDDVAEALHLAALTVKPTFSLPYFSLGLLAMRRKDSPNARHWFERFIEIDPANSQSAYARDYLRQLM